MLEGLLAPLRVVLHRSLADWLIVVATWLVIVCATTLLATGVLYGDAVALSGLRQLIAAEPIGETSVVVDMRVDPEELAPVDEVVSRQVRRILGWTDGELARVIRSGTFDLEGGVSSATETDLAVFAAADRLEQHATLVEGAWPASAAEPMEVALSSPAAAVLGLAVGDELSLASRTGEDRTVDLRVVGRWEPDDAGERYWLGDALELSGAARAPRSGSTARSWSPQTTWSGASRPAAWTSVGGHCRRSRTSPSRTCAGCAATQRRWSGASAPNSVRAPSSASRPGCRPCSVEPIGHCWSAARACWS